MATPPPPRRDVDDALGGLDGTFLVCRDLQHAWTVDHYTAGGRGEVTRVLLCDRCGTERVDEWTLGGARVRGRYHYPPGYQVSGGVDRDAMRREVLTRAGIATRRRRGR